MIANHKGEIPFLILLIPFLLGIAVGLHFWQAHFLLILTIDFALLAVAFIGLNLLYKRLNLYKAQWIGGAIAAALLFVTGWISVLQYNELNSPRHFSGTKGQYLIVKINNEPTLKNGLVRFTVSVEKTVNKSKQSTVTGNLLIAIKDTLANNLYYGDELLIPAKVSPIEPPYNPAEFNYRQYLANQNIHYQAFLYTKQYRVINHQTGNALIAYSLQLRKHLVEKLKINLTDTSAIAVASTLILGYKADLSNDILQAYSKTGTIHVLSVSGAHVAIIFILLNFVLGFLNKYKYGKIIKAVLTIGLIWYYSLLTGFSPAVCRAAVMITMVIIGKTYNRYINTLNILAISAFALLLYDPLFIVDVGFQLSYLAVVGLIVFQPIVYKWFDFKNKWVDKLWALCSVSIAAQVITFPLSAFYFHQFPVYFLVSNLFIVIPVEVIMYVGILYLSLPQIPFLSKALGYILEHSILIMNKVLAWIEYAPFASIGKIWLTKVEYLLAYVFIICIFYFLFDRKRWLLKVSMVAILFICISFSFKSVKAHNESTMAVLNLKKHKALIFKDSNKAVVLSDLKADDKNYQYSVQPYLDSSKIAKTEVFDLNKNVTTSYLIKKGSLIQFKNKLLLIFDGELQNNQLPQKLRVDYVYITGNPHTSVALLNKNFAYKQLIIDAGNSDLFIKSIVDEAKIAHINYQLLKRNKALIISSN